MSGIYYLIGRTEDGSKDGGSNFRLANAKEYF